MSLLKISEPGQTPMPHQFKRVIGIDLGTTHSLAATVESDGVHVIHDAEGNALLPSVVYFGKGGVITGDAARLQAVEHPHSTLSSFKRWLGRSISELSVRQDYDVVQPEDGSHGVVTVRTEIGNVNAIQASAAVLTSLVARAESYLGGALYGAVITVPAYFDETQRQLTKDAAELAGINVLRLINEPTAAAVAYGLSKADDRLVAVYDLGGGTFDISILQLSDGVFEVLATGGNSALGGDDFDKALANWIALQASQTIELLASRDIRALMQLARQCKQVLSDQDTADIDFKGDAFNWAGSISRSQFEGLIQPLIEKTLTSCKQCLRDAGLAVDEIADVVMVGGSTRVPLVREAVTQLFAQPVKVDVDPDQVVALGAAIQADMLADNNQRQQDILLLDVTPLSLGLETLGGLVEKIIPRNTAIPVARAQEFTTAKDGQTALNLHVLQGERERVEDCRSLAQFTLSGLPPMVAGAAKIKVIFTVDADGLLEVSAEETETNVKAHVRVEPTNGLSDTQITDMLQSSFLHAEEDKQSRQLMEQVVDGRTLLDAVNNALQQDGDLLNASERADIDIAMMDVHTAISTNQVETIRRAVAMLGRKTEDFAARRMNKSINEALQGKSLDDLQG